jgi:hypothetical protein
MKKLLSLVLVSLVSLNCASFGSARGQGTKSYLVGHAALVAVSDTEPKLVCGRPSAAPAPACVPLETHHLISAKIEQAAKLDKQANALLMDLPVTAPQPAEVVRLVTDVVSLVSEILGLLPDGPQKAQLKQIAQIK